MNVKIGRKSYVVDLDTRKVKNKDGGLLRKQEKIDEILKVAEQLRARRNNILNK